MANIGSGVYSVEYSKDALKTLIRIPRTTRELIQAKVDAFAKASTFAWISSRVVRGMRMSVFSASLEYSTEYTPLPMLAMS